MLGLALVALLAFSAVAAGAASAAEAPRWRVGGQYLKSGTAMPFTAVNSNEVTLNNPSRSLIFSAAPGKCVETGEIEAAEPGVKKNIVLTCESVKTFIAGKDRTSICPANSVGSPAGTIKTNSLKSTLVWLNASEGGVGELLKPTSGENLAAIEIKGATCPLNTGASNLALTNAAIAKLLPVEIEKVIGELSLPSTPVLSYYNNEAPRAKQSIEQLKLGALAATLSGTFSFSLNSGEIFAAGGPATTNKLRWRVAGSFLSSGEKKPFTATSFKPLTWYFPSYGATLEMPTCTETGSLSGSAFGSPGGKQEVNLSCKGVAWKGTGLTHCTVNTPGELAGNIVFSQLHSTIGGELIPAAETLFKAETTGSLCPLAGLSSNFYGNLKDTMRLPNIGEEGTKESSFVTSGIFWGGNNFGSAQSGEMSTLLNSGQSFGAFEG